MEHHQVRTMFCGCDTGSTCANPFNDTTFTTDITDDSDRGLQTVMMTLLTYRCMTMTSWYAATGIIVFKILAGY